MTLSIEEAEKIQRHNNKKSASGKSVEEFTVSPGMLERRQLKEKFESS